MPPIDLSSVPVVDNHCHGMYIRQGPFDVAAWRQLFTESYGPQTRAAHVASTVFYQRLVRDLAAFWHCDATEEAVLAARARQDGDVVIRTLLRAANVDALLVDQGYPPRDQLLPDAEVAALGNCRAAPMLRLETLMQELIARHETLADTAETLRAALQDVRGQGYVALKSIAAYRTGLDIGVWTRAEAEGAFAEARSEVAATGAVRLAQKPLLDTLLHVAFEEAARQEVPVQFHTGYGDTDADLLLANPLHLRSVLERPTYRGMPVVLLHESYPYTRQGAYLAAVYDTVYLDLSYAIPLLSYGEMLSFTRAALGVAPLWKLMYSSDAVGVPELLWSGAEAGRRVLGEALGELMASGELDYTAAEAFGAAILRENAVQLYQL